ncbi:hypothetical protein ACFV9E_09070 [Streptomyces sp. NPDC059835]|uniref:hypothetical protein n=1 Tax=Streptomyces sp. NPDC059835 TaxID=3346967 RepID=UPI00364B272D
MGRVKKNRQHRRRVPASEMAALTELADRAYAELSAAEEKGLEMDAAECWAVKEMVDRAEKIRPGQGYALAMAALHQSMINRITVHMDGRST